jgi:large conductance mechanosensitive channel
MLKDFKDFAMRGNVIDLAVGIVIGGAFATIVKSFVADILMPPIGLLFGNVDFANLFLLLKEGTAAAPYATVAAAKEVGAVTMNYGVFIMAIISFLIIAFSVFLVVRGISNMKKKEEEAPAAPADPPKQEVLLEEIRDLLKSRS